MSICLVWDFDNTLAYRDGMWTRSACNILERNGFVDYDLKLLSNVFKTGFPWHFPEKAHIEYFDGCTWWEFANKAISRAFEAIGVKGKKNDFLTSQFKEEYLKKSEWHLYEDTISSLTRSKEMGYSNIIISNHTPELNELAESLGISKYFDSVTSSALVGYEKPNSKIFAFVIDKLDHDKYIMIGDNYKADVIGALKFGIDAILVRKDNEKNYEKYSRDLYGIWKYI